MIDALASQPHYWDHLRPIWEALPPEMRGTVHATSRSHPWGEKYDRRRADPTVPTIVASWVDYEQVKPRPVVYVEHGAGQSYAGDPRMAAHPCYPGGKGLDRVVLFLVPGPHAAGPWREAYPDVTVVEIGCPRLDRLHALDEVDDRRHDQDDDEHGEKVHVRDDTHPTVAVTSHWDWWPLPETRSALSWFRPGLAELAADDRWHLIGHGHPRHWSRFARLWADLGVEAVADPDEVLRRADLLVLDNTSFGPEAASCGIPLLWLTPPWYRRDVIHGGRFWDWPRGQVTCEGPETLVESVALALADPPSVSEARETMLGGIYAHRDGRAAERGAAAICEALGGSDAVGAERGRPHHDRAAG